MVQTKIFLGFVLEVSRSIYFWTLYTKRVVVRMRQTTSNIYTSIYSRRGGFCFSRRGPPGTKKVPEISQTWWKRAKTREKRGPTTTASVIKLPNQDVTVEEYEQGPAVNLFDFLPAQRNMNSYVQCTKSVRSRQDKQGKRRCKARESRQYHCPPLKQLKRRQPKYC
jgi:hypothetical protein